MLRSHLALALLATSLAACDTGAVVMRNVADLAHAPAPAPHRITHPYRPDARLAITWIGHATALVQIDDKFVLTDPLFNEMAGEFSRRVVEPGTRPEDLPHVDAVVISHLHPDHLSTASLQKIERKVGFLVVPEMGTLHVPDFSFETVELATWNSFERGGLRITATPVRHTGFRWGIDGGWMRKGFTGYVIEYHGISVYFGGDTAWTKESFEETHARFPHLDLALLPIAPVNPRSVMESRHIDPREALWAFRILDARWMVPVHYATFPHGTDPPDYPAKLLEQERQAQGVPADRVRVPGIGEQVVLISRR